MDSLSDFWEDDDDGNLELNTRTGMSSDFITNLDIVPMFMRIYKWKTLTEIIHELSAKPDWIIISYSDFIAKKSQRLREKMRNIKALSRIKPVDSLIYELKEEIQKNTVGKMDEANFREIWHKIYVLIYWRKSSVIF